MIVTQNVITSTTWANKPSAYITGQPVFISNAGTKGSHWFHDGTRWKPMNGSAVLASLDAASSNIGNSETIVFQYQMPAGLWQTGDRLRLYLGEIKSGTTDTATVRVRIGTAGTTADTQIVGVVTMAAGTRQIGLISDIRLESATSALQLTNSRSPPGYGGTAIANAFDAAVAISSATANALWVSVGILSGGAADTVALVDAQLQLISKAN